MRSLYQLGLAAFVAVDACGSAQTAPPTSSAASSTLSSPQHLAVVAEDRSADDRALDSGRHPEETLVFFGIAPGMHVAEIEAGRGYTSELLARVVGPKGSVYAQNSRFILEKFADKPLTERLAKPVNSRIVRVDRELEDPLPPEARELDAVLDILFYHDTVWMKADRTKMNAAIFNSLKHGGIYGIIDHSARAGSGTADVQTLHRIEESVVREEILSAGFKLGGEASFLRNPTDTRDWSASPSTAGERRGTTDRFVIKFVKP